MEYCTFCMKLTDGAAVCPACGRASAYDCPPHHLLPGTVLNKRYLIGASLGEGGFGITYIGRDLNLDIRVAVKEYYPNGFANRNNTISAGVTEPATEDRKEFYEKGRKSFLREARALAKFKGEYGVVDVQDFFEENNTAYIVMEYLDGETLKKHLQKKGTLPWRETVEMLMPVMRSLERVHQAGLIHRDISPDNIMLVGSRVKLLDFGAARDVSPEAGKSLSILLKPGYAPEEQYRTRGNQGPWTDIYGLCATIYKCVTGVTPEASIDRLAQDDVKNPSELGVAIDRKAEKIIMKGMAVYAANRYQNIGELLADLSPVITRPSGSGTGEKPAIPQPRVPAAPPAAPPAQPFDPQARPAVQTGGCPPAGGVPPAGGAVPPGANPYPQSGAYPFPSEPAGPVPAPPAKKKKTGLIVGAVSAVLVLALAVAVAFGIKAIKDRWGGAGSGGDGGTSVGDRQDATPPYTKGELKGNVYTNEWAGVRFPIPEGFVNGSAKDYEDSEDGLTETGFSTSSESDDGLFLLMFEDVGYIDGDVTAEEYIDIISEDWLEEGDEENGWYLTDSFPLTIAGETYQAKEMDNEWIDYTQIAACRVYDGRVICFFCWSGTETVQAFFDSVTAP